MDISENLMFFEDTLLATWVSKLLCALEHCHAKLANQMHSLEVLLYAHYSSNFKFSQIPYNVLGKLTSPKLIDIHDANIPCSELSSWTPLILKFSHKLHVYYIYYI